MYDPIRQFRDCVHVSDSGGAMKREDVLRIAQEMPCICNHITDYASWSWDEVVEFANIIAAHEREECAKLCEDNDHLVNASHLAHTIRARSE